jgi:hypothetical protein
VSEWSSADINHMLETLDQIVYELRKLVDQPDDLVRIAEALESLARVYAEVNL